MAQVGNRNSGRRNGGHFLRLHTFSSLQYVNFRYLWGSTIFTSAGDWIQQITLSWYIYELTNSPALVGILQAFRGLPFILAGPLSGVLADRLDRRRYLLRNQVFLTLLALGMAILVTSGYVRVWHLFVFAFLSGLGFAMNLPLRQAMVSDTVPRSSVGNAIALFAMANSVNRIIGPATGGLLIALFGPGTNFFIQAGCYVGVVAMVFPLRIEKKKPAVAPRFHPLSDLREGMVYAFKDKRVLSLMVVAIIPSMFLFPFAITMMPVFARDELHQGPGGLGLLMALLGSGGLAGTLIVASVNIRNPLLSLIAGLGAGLAMAVLSFSGTMGMALSLLFLQGIGQQVFFAPNNAILQTIIPDHMRGRVMGLYFISGSMSSMGALVAGMLARTFNSRIAMLTGGMAVVVLLTLAWIVFRKPIRASKEAAVAVERTPL